MFEENLATLRRAIDAFNRRDHDAFVAACHPEIENFPPRNWPEYEEVRGPEELWRYFIAGNDVWGEGRLDVGEAIDAGEDRLVAEVAGDLEGEASGVQVPWRFWELVAFREGLVYRIDWFPERAEALAAAGVRTQN